MNRQYKVDNLFEMARNLLEKKTIPFHLVDVIDLAIVLRKELDVSPKKFYKKYNIKREPKQTKKEVKQYKRNYYLRTREIRRNNE